MLALELRIWCLLLPTFLYCNNRAKWQNGQRIPEFFTTAYYACGAINRHFCTILKDVDEKFAAFRSQQKGKGLQRNMKKVEEISSDAEFYTTRRRIEKDKHMKKLSPKA